MIQPRLRPIRYRCDSCQVESEDVSNFPHAHGCPAVLAGRLGEMRLALAGALVRAMPDRILQGEGWPGSQPLAHAILAELQEDPLFCALFEVKDGKQ